MTYGASLPEWNVKAALPTLRAANATPNSLILVGDSRCDGWAGGVGWNTVNNVSAGWSSTVAAGAIEHGLFGITMGDVAGFVSNINLYKGRAIAIQVGVNDPVAPAPGQIANWPTDLPPLIAALRAQCPRVLLTTPLGREAGFTPYNTPALLAAQNSQVQALAQIMKTYCAANGVPVVDINGISNCSNPDGSAVTGMTLDGVHFSGEMWNLFRFFVTTELQSLGW